MHMFHNYIYITNFHGMQTHWVNIFRVWIYLRHMEAMTVTDQIYMLGTRNTFENKTVLTHDLYIIHTNKKISLSQLALTKSHAICLWSEKNHRRSKPWCVEIVSQGGHSPGKCIPLLGRHRETPTLTGTNFAKPYPYWHNILAQIYTLTGTNIQKMYPLWYKYCWKVVNWYKCWRSAPKIRPLSLENHWKNHTLSPHIWCPNPSLSGTLHENPTLCGSDIGQNGTLAILAYVYCRQWECPPPLGM